MKAKHPSKPVTTSEHLGSLTSDQLAVVQGGYKDTKGNEQPIKDSAGRIPFPDCC
jgi:hypothetical protein